ncbi:MAG TPA: alpha/beta hydrolase fold domain-containing protein, partial [Solirubrobacteraceae bacterium]|nr:alpha/beta hydrolase fold domain-containing protein [Solirubrobacteraceae bacterium]
MIDAKLAAYVEESRDFYAARAASRSTESQPDPSTPEGLAEARALEVARAKDAATAMSSAPPLGEALAEVAGRRVPVRIIAPEAGTARGVYLDIHGGGFYMGLAARGDALNRSLANALGIAVVSVDYRLAPEHPWPAASDDCETAALWLLGEAETRFGTTRLAIGGISAGATLAMATLLRLRDRGVGDPFVGAVLQFGTYDMSGKTPAGRLLDGE